MAYSFIAAPRSEMVEETRAKLIRAGRAAFAEKGYAAASMDELAAEVGLTRGALYHNFGDKRGLLQAVVDQIDTEMSERARNVGRLAANEWDGLLAECVACIEMALEPEVQRIMLLDGPAVLGDPSRWPTRNRCLRETTEAIRRLIEQRTIKPIDPEAAARPLNGAMLNAALRIAASEHPQSVLPKAVDAFRSLAEGLLTPSTSCRAPSAGQVSAPDAITARPLAPIELVE